MTNSSQNTALSRLLGDELVSHGGCRLDVAHLSGRVVALYFAAGWCGSCKSFAEQLNTFYGNFQKIPEHQDSLKVVLVSSDRSEAQFNEHLQRIPWSYALRFNDRTRKKYLARKFRAHKIPKLILLDRITCEVITPNGKEHVLDDPDGKNFPWKPRPLVEILNEIKYLTTDGAHVDFHSFSNSYKGLYFSAHWCPPCKALTPQLAETYRKVQDRGVDKLEIIFVSSDRSEQSFCQYHSTMPWKAVPYHHAAIRRELALKFQVEGIPTLIILDENNDVITRDGRFEVLDDPEGECLPWYPRPVDELTEKYSDKMDQEPCVILFTEEEELDAAFRILEPVAQTFLDPKRMKNISDTTESNFLKFFCGGDAEFCESLRDFFELDDQVPLLVILDIADGKKYILEDDVEITPLVITNFINGYLTGEVDGLPVRSQLTN